MTLPASVRSYFEAWNSHDADALGAIFTGEATYEDSASQGPLAGPAMTAYASELFAGFPDLKFEEGDAIADNAAVVVRWRMLGTNSAPMAGNPPTGGSIDVPGIDFITLVDGNIRSVRGYFDRQSMYEQLGLKVVPLPDFGPLKAGTGVYMNFGKVAKPGGLSFTVLGTSSPEERLEIQNRSLSIVAEMSQMDSFISFFGFNIGDNMCTLTAWTDPAAALDGARVPAHKAAARKFYHEEDGSLGSGGMLSIWAPQSIRSMAVCPSCGKWSDAVKNPACPKCQTPLPAPSYF